MTFQLRVNSYPPLPHSFPHVRVDLLHVAEPFDELLVDVGAHGWPGRSYDAARDLAKLFADISEALAAYAADDPGEPFTGMMPVVPQPTEPSDQVNVRPTTAEIALRKPKPSPFNPKPAGRQ